MVYGEVMDENPIPTNQGFEAPIVKGDKPKNRPRIGLNNSKSKEKKGVKEKVHEKSDKKYEPPHRRNKKEEGCITWMNRVSWVPKIDRGDFRDPSLKEAPS